MADLLAQGAAWLAQQQKSHASRTVTYRRGAAAKVIDATVGRTVLEAPDDLGVVVRQEVRDYLVHAADLDFGAGPVPPQRGDQIEEPDGAAAAVYEVLPLGPEQETWRYADPSRIRLRIHTKRVR
jgi:hypothetical protein